MRGFVVFVSIIFLLLSCDRKERINLPDIEERKSVAVDCTPPLINPRCIFVTDDRVVVYQSATEFPFLVYSLPLTGSGLSQGTRGRGPGEVLMPDEKSFMISAKGFSFFEQGGIKKTFGWDDSDDLICVSTQETEIGTAPLNGVKELSTGYLNVSMNPAYEYTLTNHDGTTENICRYPDFETGQDEFMPMRFFKTVSVHPDKEKFAAFYGFDPFLRIVSSEGKIRKEVLLPLEGVVKEPYNRPVCFFGNVCSDKKHILAKFADREFLLFNWDGDLLRRFRIDTDINTFTYDFKNDILYAIDATPSDGPQLVYCDHFLKQQPL